MKKPAKLPVASKAKKILTKPSATEKKAANLKLGSASKMTTSKSSTKSANKTATKPATKTVAKVAKPIAKAKVAAKPAPKVAAKVSAKGAAAKAVPTRNKVVAAKAPAKAAAKTVTPKAKPETKKNIKAVNVAVAKKANAVKTAGSKTSSGKVANKAHAEMKKSEPHAAKAIAKPVAEIAAKSDSKQNTSVTSNVPTKVAVLKSDSKTVIKPTKISAKAEKVQETSDARSSSTAPVVNQTTDAAVLAAIDTSGYILPGVKVPGRRGRKPKEYQPENEEMAALNAVERAELKAIDKAKAKDRKSKLVAPTK